MIDPLPLRFSLDAGMKAFKETREEGAMMDGSWTAMVEFRKLGDGDLDRTEDGRECVSWGRCEVDKVELIAPCENKDDARDGGLIIVIIVDVVSELLGLVSMEPFVAAG